MKRAQIRALAWILLLILTCLILFFPIHMSSQYRSIQAPYIFDNLPLFSSLFCLWILVAICLAFSKSDAKANWEHLILAGIFGLVFIGFWVFITYPYGSYADDIYNTGHVRYLIENGHIPINHPLLAYFDYPGMHLLLSAISQISGLSIFESRTLFLMFNAGLFCALMYLLFTKWLKKSRLAFLAVLLLLMTGGAIIDKMHIFTPGAFAFTLLAVFLLSAGLSREPTTNRFPQTVILEILVFSAITISYFATSFLLPLILTGIYLVQRLARTKPSVTISSILLFSLMFLAWFFYDTWNTLHSLTGFLPRILDSLRSGEFLSSIMTLWQANAGAELPLWANAIRLFWWGILGIATLLALCRLFIVKKLTSAEKVEIGGVLGILALTALGLTGTKGGSQFVRYLLYAPLFAIPLLIGFWARSTTWGRRMLIALVICITILSLPTFLSSVNTVATDSIYSYDASSGKFLESHSRNNGTNIIVFRASTTTASSTYYYLHNISFRNIPELVYYAKDDFWLSVEKVTTAYMNPNTNATRQKLFIVDEKTYVPAQHLLEISPEDQGWQTLNTSLSSTNLFYNNGQVQMYTP